MLPTPLSETPRAGTRLTYASKCFQQNRRQPTRVKMWTATATTSHASTNQRGTPAGALGSTALGRI